MRVWTKVRSLFRRQKIDADMAEEMRQHLEEQTAANVRAGMSLEDARFAAQRSFGNVASVQQQCREQRSWLWLEHWVRDFGLAVRSLRRSPGFAAGVIVTLALCIGPNTAVLSALYSMVLKPLPFRDPQQLVVIKNVGTKAGGMISGNGVPQYLDFVAQADRFEQLALLDGGNSTFGEDSVPIRIMGSRATAGIFDLLGVKPVLGRFFTADEQTLGREHVMVLSHSFWVSQYQADPTVIGREVRLDGEMHTIIGVAPPALSSLFLRMDFLRPLPYGPKELNPGYRYDSRATLVGRLKPGILAADAQAQLTAIESRYWAAAATPAMREAVRKAGFRIVITPWRSDILVPVDRPLFMLQAGALLVLLIGAVNVANLMLGRVNTRRNELAIRVALGAGSGALFRQLFCEVMMLVGIASAAGLALGWGSVELLNRTFVFASRFVPSLHLEGGIVAVVLLLAAGIALVVGLAPLFLMRRSDLRVSETRMASASGKVRLVSSTLVVGQVALALVLLVGAGLLIRSFAKVLAVNPGFDTTHVVQGRIALTRAYGENEANVGIRRRTMDAVRAIPGVNSVAVSSYFGVGMASSYRTLPYTVRRIGSATENPPMAYIHPVSAGFFHTMGARLLEGRDFVDADDVRSSPGYIVDRAFAERHFPGRSAVGEEIAFGAGPFPDGFRWARIVGVVERLNVVGLEQRDGLPFIYTPLNQGSAPGFNLIVNSARAPSDILAAMREELRKIDPTLPLYQANTLGEVLDLMLLPRRAVMMLLAIFAALALLLAAVGLYGVLAYDVSQRTKEIGIRNAIGASRAQIIALILRQGLRRTGLGLLVGFVVAWFMTRFLQSLLFDVKRADPASYLGVTALLLLVALLACWLPARRAAKVDPIIALRAE